MMNAPPPHFIQYVTLPPFAVPQPHALDPCYAQLVSTANCVAVAPPPHPHELIPKERDKDMRRDNPHLMQLPPQRELILHERLQDTDYRLLDVERRTPFDDMNREDRGCGGGDKWMTESPTNTILLRGLPSDIDEKDIRAELMLFGAPVKDVRLMKNKSTGASRGFAFVEFQTIDDAQRWIAQNQGSLRLLNQFNVQMYFSSPRTNDHNSSKSNSSYNKSDWTCAKCGVQNFKRRDHCFKCNLSREAAERVPDSEGFDQVGQNPCNTLILRGLDALTTDDSICNSLSRYTHCSPKNLAIVKDHATQASKGFGFMEMTSIQEASQLMELFSSSVNPLEVDGKAIMINYAKNTFKTTMAQIAVLNPETSQWDYNSPEYQQYYDQQQFYDTNSQAYYDYYYGQGFYQQADAQNATQADSTNAAAAVAQAAIQQAQASKNSKKSHDDNRRDSDSKNTPKSNSKSSPSIIKMPTSPEQQAINEQQSPPEYNQFNSYPPPDVSSYQFDESTGYYYDHTTGLYYDSNSQYYYNADTGQFMYWDSEHATYLPAPDSNQDECQDDKKKDFKEKKDSKVKIAKKIAKDMEKWAKTLNKKECRRDPSKKISLAPDFSASRTADAGFAVLEKKYAASDMIDDKTSMPPPPTPGSSNSNPGLVAQYGGDSGESDDDDDSSDEKFADYKKMACLLCKRQFPDKEILVKHMQMSGLHKENLEAYRAKLGMSSQKKDQAYRDRAKERRDKFGSDAPPAKRRGPPTRPANMNFEQPNNKGIQDSNIGNKLLQKMGWNQGEGLGKQKQGIVDPIKAKSRSKGAGLGARGSNYDIGPTETYKEAVKKTMFLRFQEMHDS